MSPVTGIGSALGAYLKAQIQNAAIVIALFVAGSAVARVPWWPLVGVLCGLLNLIPVLGSLCALAVGLLAAWAGAHGWPSLAYFAAVWLVIQVVDGFFLSPRAAARAGVHPIVSILLTIGAGLLFGPVGIVLAVPVAAVTLVIWRATRPRTS